MVQISRFRLIRQEEIRLAQIGQVSDEVMIGLGFHMDQVVGPNTRPRQGSRRADNRQQHGPLAQTPQIGQIAIQGRSRGDNHARGTAVDTRQCGHVRVGRGFAQALPGLF